MIRQIASIQPNGSFESQHGTLYSFIYGFTDNTNGSCNHKTAHPPFRQGDQVEVEITGDHRGVSKLKIQKPQQATQGSFQAPQAPKPTQGSYPTRPAPRQAPMPQQQDIHPATVGMALKEACALVSASQEPLELSYLHSQAFSKDVYLVASDIIRMARALEAGKLAPPARDRANPGQEAEPEPEPEPVYQAPPPPPPTPAYAPNPQDDSEDVPF